QEPLAPDTLTLARFLRQHGYATGAIGKWGLGGPGSSGHPCEQGFDSFYGFLCQRAAQNHYPPALWRDHEREELAGNRAGNRVGAVYAQDRFLEETLSLLERNRGRPFFLYLPWTLPHAALQVPDEDLARYRGRFPETPYDGREGY